MLRMEFNMVAPRIALAPLLLWIAAALLYGAWLRRRDLRGGQPPGARQLSLAGWALAAAVLGLAIAAGPWGAAVTAAIGHFTGAVSAMAVLTPLARRPPLRPRALCAVGGLFGLLEALP